MAFTIGVGFGLGVVSLLLSDVGCPSVYVLLLLVDEQSCFSQWFSRVKSGRKSQQRYIESRRSKRNAV